MTNAYFPHSSAYPSPHPGSPNHEAPEIAHAREIIEQFAIQCAENRERLYWHMIAHGQLPSQGWRCAEKIETDLDTGRLTHKCWPVEPDLP